jgi:hypothetical protein
LSISPSTPARPLRITATPGPNPGKRFTLTAGPL